MLIAEQHLAGMSVEADDTGRQTAPARLRDDLFEQYAVAAVDAVELADGDDARRPCGLPSRTRLAGRTPEAVNPSAQGRFDRDREFAVLHACS
jgi:hypothetical protein